MSTLRIKPALLVLFFLDFLAVGCGNKEESDKGQKVYMEAEAAYKAGQYEKAVKLFTEAAKYLPDAAGIYGNRANCYSSLGKLDEALKDYDTAIKMTVERSKNPNHPDLAYSYYNRGHAYERAKVFDKAIEDYEKTIKLNDQYPDVKNNLAWILATCSDAKLRNPNRAIKLAEGECAKTEWKNGNVLDTLAAAYAAVGDFAKATEYEQKAIKLIDDAEILKGCRERLELYRQKKPYVDPSR